MHDKIDEAVRFQKFTALKSIGQFHLDRVPDRTWPGKADERFRFGDDKVAEHCEAGGDTAGGRVGKQ